MAEQGSSISKKKVSAKSDSTRIIKKREFEAFLRTIRSGNFGHWVDIARAINVDNDTIVAWKKLPEAQEAIKQGIDHSLAQMEKVGSKDWRMHAEKLKMLGINPATKIEGRVNVDIIGDILHEFKLINDRQPETITGDTSTQAT